MIGKIAFQTRVWMCILFFLCCCLRSRNKNMIEDCFFVTGSVSILIILIEINFTHYSRHNFIVFVQDTIFFYNLLIKFSIFAVTLSWKAVAWERRSDTTTALRASHELSPSPIGLLMGSGTRSLSQSAPPTSCCTLTVTGNAHNPLRKANSFHKYLYLNWPLLDWHIY